MINLTKMPTKLAMVALFFLVFTTACKKENAQIDLTDSKDELKDELNIELVEEAFEASQYFTSSFSQATIASSTVFGLRPDEIPLEVRGACAAPTVAPLDFTTYPKTITSNYGLGCTDITGRTKTGKLVLTVNKYWATGSIVQAKFENYTEQGNKLDGFYNITNNSTLGVTNLTFDAVNIKFTDKDGKTTAYNIHQIHKQVGGTTTVTPWDDVYEISSTISSTLYTGTKFEFVNTTPLKKTNTCWWVQKGKGTVKLNGVPMTMDFGNDTCDNDATLTNAAGVVVNIKLKP